MKKNETWPVHEVFYAYFSVQGDFDPEEITRWAGVCADRCWKKGEVFPNTNIPPRAFSKWCLHATIPEGVDPEAQIRSVLERLETNPDFYCEISRLYQGQVSVVGKVTSRDTGIHLSSSVLARLCRFNLSVDVDLYPLQ